MRPGTANQSALFQHDIGSRMALLIKCLSCCLDRSAVQPPPSFYKKYTFIYATMNCPSIIDLAMTYPSIKCLTINYANMNCSTMNYATMNCSSMNYATMIISTMNYATVYLLSYYELCYYVPTILLPTYVGCLEHSAKVLNLK